MAHERRAAALDREQPIPVVFPLSSWAERRRPLVDWLIDVLRAQYDVPRQLGQTWIEGDRVLPLLDGLDEVTTEYRAACVDAINTFRQAHGLLPVAVCSRLADYEALGRQLRLQGAIVIQPLTRADVDRYLAQIGPPLTAVRQAVQANSALGELVDTPLMLTVVTLAYAGRPIATLHARETPEDHQRHLFAAYVERVLQRRSPMTRYTRQQTERWLAWLAWQMTQHHQTLLSLERLQPTWLPDRVRWIPRRGACCPAGWSAGWSLGSSSG